GTDARSAPATAGHGVGEDGSTAAGRPWLVAAGLIGVWLVYVWYSSRATGIYNDDDLGHYFMARDAWHAPRLFLNVWGRPLFTLLYALPARWGFDAVQLTTTVVTVLGALVTGRAALRLGLRGGLAAGLQATMPFVLLLSTASLTEPLCALVLALALAARAAGRERRFALWASLVPLARLELTVLVVAWALLLVRRRRWLDAALTGTGLAVWALAAALAHGEPLWLWRQVVTGESNLYGTTPLWHYPQGLVYVVGPVVFLFLLVDLVVRRDRRGRARGLDWITGSALGALLLYMVLAWRVSFGHSAGFLRHLVAVSPLFALMAARGLEVTFARVAAGDRRPLRILAGGVVLIGLFLSRGLVMHHRAVGPFEVTRLAAGLIILGLVGLAASRGGARRLALRHGPLACVLLALVYGLAAEPPLRASAEQLAVRRCFDWYLASRWRQAPVVATHPWLEFHLDAVGRRPPGGSPPVGRRSVEAAPPESVIFWDSHYSLRADDRMTLADFKFDPRFEMRFESITPDSLFVMYALVKH
ncbi:MAG: hypothetical protein PVF43_05585, partial [Candidatus Eiseniibacteriota bacterium]